LAAGRPRKPTALKELEGTARKDRATANEPRPDVKVPGPPAWLGPDARNEWRRITKELAALRMISLLDRTTLGLYCQALQEYLDACRGLDAERKYMERARARGADERLLRRAAEGKADAEEEPPFPDSGLTALSSQGTRLIHPLVSIRNEAWRRVLRAAAEFGLSPSSRTRISIPVEGPEKPGNPFLQLMG
jgi:P27 family predicted phage terminase small subunit